jgi:hypothetical protein
MFLARHMVAWAAEGGRQEEQLGVQRKTVSSQCGQHFTKKKEKVKLLLSCDVSVSQKSPMARYL